MLSAVAAVVSALTYGLALQRRSFLLGVLGALDLAMFLGFFGAWLDRGSALGLAMFSLGGSALYLLFTRVATAPSDTNPAIPYAGGAVVCAAVSALAGLHVMADRWATHGVAGAAWPYAVALAALAASRVAGPGGSAARFVAAATLTLAPTLEALIRDELGFTLVALALGTGLLLAAALALAAVARRGAHRADVPRARRGPRGADDAGPAGARSPRRGGRRGRTGRVDHPHRGRARAAADLVRAHGAGAARAAGCWRCSASAPSSRCSPCACSATRGTSRRRPWSSAARRRRRRWGFTRRAAVLAVGATALGVNLWVQYFARLAGVLPLSVRLVGFGVGLLIGGVIYEQTLRRRMSALASWD
ncbi:MAG: hypothetical protein U0325_18845 [Polyangiales bacterium]